MTVEGFVPWTQDPTEQRYDDLADAIDAIRASGISWSEGDVMAKANGLTQIDNAAVRAIYLENGDWDAGLAALSDPAATGIPTWIIRGDPAQGGLIADEHVGHQPRESARITSSRSPAQATHPAHASGGDDLGDPPGARLNAPARSAVREIAESRGELLEGVLRGMRLDADAAIGGATGLGEPPVRPSVGRQAA